MTTTAQHLQAFSSLLAADTTVSRLNQRHLQILAYCCACAHPPSVLTIAQAIVLSPSATSRAVDKMIDLGLITRRENTENRRFTSVEPTAEGRTVDRRVQQLFVTARTRRPAA